MIQGTKIYKVSIANAAGSSDTKKGFLDNLKVSDYSDFDISAQPINGETLEQYKIKARGLVRFNQMCLNLQRGLDTLTEVTTEGANHITPPTKIEFKLVYTQADGLMVEVDSSEYADEEEIVKLRDGRVFFVGTKAIKRLIAKALVEDFNVIANYFDNTNIIKGMNGNWKTTNQVNEKNINVKNEADQILVVGSKVKFDGIFKVDILKSPISSNLFGCCELTGCSIEDYKNEKVKDYHWFPTYDFTEVDKNGNSTSDQLLTGGASYVLNKNIYEVIGIDVKTNSAKLKLNNHDVWVYSTYLYEV